MARSRALPVTAALAVAAGLTLGAAGTLDLLERSAGDRPFLQRLVPDRPVTDPDRSAGAAPVPTPGPAQDTSRGAAPDPAPDPSRPGPHTRLRSAPAPALLHIGPLGVSAPVVRVGLLEDGGMEIPDDVTTVGWYATEARRISPGDEGTAVIAGHRDGRSQGDGALVALEGLVHGDIVHVVHLDGQVSSWRIDEVVVTPRDELPMDRLFARVGPPRLALVTCGGRFDATMRRYTHNVIAFASLAG